MSKSNKNNTYGKCRICLRHSKLTEDHVPPQGGIEIKPVEIENALDIITGRNPKRNFYISQNGIKFKTLCGYCNNTELGGKYDPILNDFAKDANVFLKSSLVLPNIVSIETKPNSLIRAVLGHLLAAKNEMDNSDFDKRVRQFIFDESKSIPDDINIFYWIYPYNITVIVRDFAMPAKRNIFNELAFCHLLKYSPVAYLITDKDEYEGLKSLNDYRRCGASEIHSIPIRLDYKKDWTWPEFPEPDSFMVMGKGFEDSVYATPRQKKTTQNKGTSKP